MSILSREKAPSPIAIGESTVIPKVEKKRSRKIPTAFMIGMLGLLGAWVAGQMVPLTTFEVPYPEKIRLAEDSAASFRNSLIESGDYESSKEMISEDILDSVRKIIFYETTANSENAEPEKDPFVATSIIVEQFVDELGNDHKILLLNAHGIPNPDENTLSLKTDDGLFTGIVTTCLPYDYVGQNLYFVDQTKPIRDLALCDFKIIKKPENSTAKLEPLNLEKFKSTSNFTAQQTYLAYGFPVNPNWSEQDAIYSTHDFLVSNFTYKQTANGLNWFVGDPYGPGGSGGVLINEEGEIEGLMTGYNIPRNTSVINTILSINAGNANWFIEEIPADLAEKVNIFTDQAMDHSFQNVAVDKLNFKYIHDSQ